jgi:hypothetical protein
MQSLAKRDIAGGHNPLINLTPRDGYSYALPDYREKGGL